VQTARPRQEVLFVHLLWAQDRHGARRPRCELTTDESFAVFRLTLDGEPVVLRISLKADCGGELSIGPRAFTLSDQIMPTTPLPSEDLP
jgi:hypothetical protein